MKYQNSHWAMILLSSFKYICMKKGSRLRHAGQECITPSFMVFIPCAENTPPPSSLSFDEKIAFFCFLLECGTAVLTGSVSSVSLINSAVTFFYVPSLFKALHSQRAGSQRWDQWRQSTTLFITINVSRLLHPQLFSSFGWQKCQMYLQQSLQIGDCWWGVEHSKI